MAAAGSIPRRRVQPVGGKDRGAGRLANELTLVDLAWVQPDRASRVLGSHSPAQPPPFAPNECPAVVGGSGQQARRVDRTVSDKSTAANFSPPTVSGIRATSLRSTRQLHTLTATYDLTLLEMSRAPPQAEKISDLPRFEGFRNPVAHAVMSAGRMIRAVGTAVRRRTCWR